MKSAKGVPFGGFVKKFSPHPHYLPNSENVALQKPFFLLKTRINLGGSATNIRIRIYSKQPMGSLNFGLKS